MTFRRERTRADGTDEDCDDSAAGDREKSAAGDHEKSAAADRETTTGGLTRDQHREWRRWIVETACRADYGVIPVDQLVDEIIRREPDEIDRSAVRRALTESILPVLDRESVLDYDGERELLINYGD